MRLASGVGLGPYEVAGFLGAGGMGEVYRARDTRLGRSVALKVLPDYGVASPDRLRRFEQEATAASALNHPAIYYGAAWDGGPIQIFSTRTDSPQSRALDLAEADVLAISSPGDMAVSLRRNPFTFPSPSLGTLGRVALAGGAPREVVEDVQAADWSADGRELAVVRVVEGRRRLEYPIEGRQ